MSRAVLLHVPARALALCCMAAFVACTDGLRPDATGSIALHIVTADQPTASVVGTRAAAMTQGHLEAATATASNGTTTKTINLTGGTGSSTFTGTITGLPVGTYTVTVEGLVGGQVDYYGQTSGVTVQANSTSDANVSWNSFIPGTVTPGPSPTWSFSPIVSFTAVPSATSYVVEADKSSAFNTPAKTSTTVTSTSGYVQVSDTGTWYIRVRAVNTTVAGSGRPTTPITERVVTDLRPAGADLSSADSLGFGTNVPNVLDSLNVYPAGDVDWFALSECNGDSVTVTAQAVRLSPPSPLNSALAVFSGLTGRLVAANDDADSTDARVRLALKSDGTYKVAVTGAKNTVGHYKLAIQVKAGNNQQPGGCNVTPLPGVTSVASGVYHTCMIRSGGVTDCWGWNSNGQLGVSPTTVGASASPIQVSGGQTFTSVVAGAYHSCALDGGGNAYCWGWNGWGQLGDGTTTDRATPATVSGITLSSLTAGDNFTCGLSGGYAYCWGSGVYGQLGNGSSGSNTYSSSPVAVSGSHQFMSIAAGARHVCGVTIGGAMWCWGGNASGQLGNGGTSLSSVPVSVSGGFTFIAAAAGGFHSCGLRSSGGAAYCWGANADGELGNGTTSTAATTTPDSVLGYGFVTLSAGRYATCSTDGSNQASCWGDDFDGQLGDGATVQETMPVLVAGGVYFQTVSPGGFHTCGVETSTGNGYCWGWNGFGQTGDGSAFDQTGPVAVDASQLGGGVQGVSTGHEHSCAVSAGGAAYCWGWNTYGQLGNGTYTSSSTPQPVALGYTYQTVSAGASATCALTTGHSVYCWGDNTYGELGNGSYTSSNLPQVISGSWNVLSMGDNHACVLDVNGYAACWGDNSNGQLGIGSTTGSDAPALVFPPSGGGSALTFQQISAGSDFSCGVTTAGAAYCWGADSVGQLGNGSPSVSPLTTPTPVSGSYTWSSVQAGLSFACGLTTGNDLYCWGANDYGQLGDGTYSNNSTPVLVSGGHTWKTFSVSRNDDACGITMSDVLYCWGDNFTGRLGNGTFVTSNTPVLVQAAVLFASVSSGDVHTCGVSSGSGTAYCWGNNERGELGYGMLTIRTAPAWVRYGPASAPARGASVDQWGATPPPVIHEPGRTGSAGASKVRVPRRVSGLR
jgi:alpha-tubulin suppressor-like RCC1 family protein